MRQQVYKFQTRQAKHERQDSSGRIQQLTKVNSYTPGNWKSYIPHQISLSSQKRSNRTPSYFNDKLSDAAYDNGGDDDSRIKSILNSRKDQERRRQDIALKKVRQLQDKVLPLVKGNRDDDQGAWIGWQSRIQQKLLRLEGHLDNTKKQMELEMQKRIIQLENKWENRFSQYLRSLDRRL